MSWLIAILVALAAFGAVALMLRRRRDGAAARQGLEAVGAALLLGIAGYGLQASPGLPGAPKAPAQRVDASAQAMVRPVMPAPTMTIG